MGHHLTRRQFLQASLLVTAGLPGLRPLEQPVTTPNRLYDDPKQTLTGAINRIHDPAIIRAGDTYYVFSTGRGLMVRQSSDLINWEIAFPPVVFSNPPKWVQEAIPGQADMWAPDISYFNDRYHLYYAVSTFGSSRSVIGLATNKTLNPKDPAFEWVDEGLVVESGTSSNYNCIDANLILDGNNLPWLAFGSFWSGIKMRRLDYATGKPSSTDEKLYALARRTVNSGSVEAPFIIRKGNFYYLFVSFDFCCRGADSTYRVMVGRSENVTGPYADREGVAMMNGGGTQVTFPTEQWRGPGHNAILQEGDTDYIVYHAYDATRQGQSALRIDRLTWDADGWPSISG